MNCGLDFSVRIWEVIERYGRHVGTRTPDLYRVKSEVKPLQPFSCLAFPFSEIRKTALKQPIFGDELVTSSVLANRWNPHFLQRGFRHAPRTLLRRVLGSIRPDVPERNLFGQLAGLFAGLAIRKQGSFRGRSRFQENFLGEFGPA